MIDLGDELNRWKTRIFGGSAVLLIVDLLVQSFDLLLTLGDVLFVPVSILFGNVAGNVDTISQAALEPLVAGLAMLYVANLLLRRVGLFDGDNA